MLRISRICNINLKTGKARNIGRSYLAQNSRVQAPETHSCDSYSSPTKGGARRVSYCYEGTGDASVGTTTQLHFDHHWCGVSGMRDLLPGSEYRHRVMNPGTSWPEY